MYNPKKDRLRQQTDFNRPDRTLIMGNTIRNYLLSFFLLIFIFSAGLILVYQIPNESLEPQYPKSIAQISNEEIYANYLFSADGSILDNYMDGLMLKTCHVSDAYDNSLHAAFDNNGYPRYWNGYLLTLRPLMTQFTYQQIRYISMFILLISFCFCFSGIHRELGWATAIGFAVSMIMCFLVFVGESLQYFSVFMVLFAEILLILYLPAVRTVKNGALLLFCAGMAVNYFDLLTAPLLTLGVPLILLLCLNTEAYARTSFEKSWLDVIRCSVVWGIGYAACWAAKWLIGTLILGDNIFADAWKTARFRVEGSEAIPLDRALMFKTNVETYFFAKGHKPFALIVILIFVMIFILLRHPDKTRLKSAFPILFVAVYPYVWFFVLSNHSQLHYFYTYRIQAITMFSVFAAIGNSIDRTGFRPAWKMPEKDQA